MKVLAPFIFFTSLMGCAVMPPPPPSCEDNVGEWRPVNEAQAMASTQTAPVISSVVSIEVNEDE